MKNESVAAILTTEMVGVYQTNNFHCCPKCSKTTLIIGKRD